MTASIERSGEARPCTEAERIRLAAFIGDLAARGRADKTIAAYQSDHAGFAEARAHEDGAPFDAARLDAAAVADYIARLAAGGARPATINRKLVFVKRYADWLGAHEVIDRATVAAVRAVRPVAQGPRRPRGLSDLELRRFLREVERRGSPRDEAIILVLLSTGLRVGELVELEVASVDIGGRRGMVLVEDTRGLLPRRRLPLAPEARRALGRYLDERGAAAGPLFQGERGPLTANAIQRIVRKYRAFAKVEASPGTLRHTFARAFLQSEGDLVELADLLGHESLDTTRLYLARPPATARPDTPPPRPRVLAGGGGD
ncbi:MAG: tyrosine-type recombinase/integrase [Myxococcales bacterium]|nr:tyrosine-type recombinase/integrase [Myxococcales bacterium]MCB9552353.1 tyrosine-type recombinase/integrase [Myxococcales bacterium]